MNLHSLGLTVAAATAAALFSACSPAAEESPSAQAEGQPAPEMARPEPAAAQPAATLNRRPAPSPSAAGNGQFKYINERGQVQLAARLEDIPESQRSTASPFQSTPIPARPERANDPVRAVSDADVTIFTTPSCGYCRAAMAYFEKQGISYENRDVQSDEEANAEYLELTGGRRGVPVIVVGEKWMQGWSQPGFEELLASAR
jgi:glutaredoxin